MPRWIVYYRQPGRDYSLCTHNFIVGTRQDGTGSVGNKNPFVRAATSTWGSVLNEHDTRESSDDTRKDDLAAGRKKNRDNFPFAS